MTGGERKIRIRCRSCVCGTPSYRISLRGREAGDQVAGNQVGTDRHQLATATTHHRVGGHPGTGLHRALRRRMLRLGGVYTAGDPRQASWLGLRPGRSAQSGFIWTSWTLGTFGASVRTSTASNRVHARLCLECHVLAGERRDERHFELAANFVTSPAMRHFKGRELHVDLDHGDEELLGDGPAN